MRKFLNILLSLFIFCSCCHSVNALTFEEGFKQSNSKPMMVLVYANWADKYSQIQQVFKSAEQAYGKVFNFVELDIASYDAKFFNSKYHIYPNLPYVLMFRDAGKVTRFVPQNCASDSSCLESRIKSFIQ